LTIITGLMLQLPDMPPQICMGHIRARWSHDYLDVASIECCGDETSQAFHDNCMIEGNHCAAKYLLFSVSLDVRERLLPDDMVEPWAVGTLESLRYKTCYVLRALQEYANISILRYPLSGTVHRNNFSFDFAIRAVSALCWLIKPGLERSCRFGDDVRWGPTNNCVESTDESASSSE
jgi:hypothetical protein